MKGWTKKLTKKELDHLRIVANCRSFAAFARTAAEQKRMRSDKPLVEPCFECKHIAIKLGLEV